MTETDPVAEETPTEETIVEETPPEVTPPAPELVCAEGETCEELAANATLAAVN